MQKTFKIINPFLTAAEDIFIESIEYKDANTIIEINADEISDGYHTMKELYEHRYALFCALLRVYDRDITPLGATTVQAWKSRLHADGTMYNGHFIAGLRRRHLDRTETQISYHLPLEWWDKIKCIELPYAPPYDGYTSQDVIERLNKL